jgi:hypothetical protein
VSEIDETMNVEHFDKCILKLSDFIGWAQIEGMSIPCCLASMIHVMQCSFETLGMSRLDVKEILQCVINQYDEESREASEA